MLSPSPVLSDAAFWLGAAALAAWLAAMAWAILASPASEP